jgi:hypothetical protein
LAKQRWQNTAAGVSVFGRASACVTSWVGDPGANRIPAGVSVGSGRSAPGRVSAGSGQRRVGSMVVALQGR